MVPDNNESLEEMVNVLVEKSNKTKPEIQQLITAKRKRLNFLITEKAAARLVANDLNVPFGSKDDKKTSEPQETIKDVHLAAPRTEISVRGVITRIHEPIEFTREKDKSKGIVQNIIISDFDEQNKRQDLRIVVWGKATEPFVDGVFSRGDIIQINRGNLRQGRTGAKELHLNYNTRLIVLTEKDVDKDKYPDPKKDVLSVDTLEASDMDRDVSATILRKGDIKKFTRKDGTEDSMAWMDIVGESKKARAVFWDKPERIHHFDPEDRILIEGCRIRVGRSGNCEVHIVKGTRVTKHGKGTIPDDLDMTGSTDTATVQKLKIEEIDDQPNIETRGRILHIGEVKEFTKSNDELGRVVRLTIFDDTGSINLILWDDDTKLVDKLQKGQAIQISGGYARLNDYSNKPEINLGRTGELLEIKDETLPHVQKMKINEIYDQDNIETRGRILHIGEVKEFTKSNDELGRVVRLTIFDDTGSINLILWDDDTKLVDKLQKGQAIQISGGYARQNNFSNKPEINLGRSGELVVVKDEEIPEYPNLVNIAKIDTQEYGLASIQAKVGTVSDMREFSRKDGSTGSVRWIQVKDSTGLIRVVAWGEQTNQFETLETGISIEIIGAEIREQNTGKELHLLPSSQIKVLTKTPDSLKQVDVTDISQDISSGDQAYERVRLSEIDNQDLIEVRAKVTRVRDSLPYYIGCDRCSKGVQENEEGVYECRTHGPVEEPVPHMRISVLLDDSTSSLWAVMLGKTAEIATNLSAKDVFALTTDDIEEEAMAKEVVRKALEGNEMLLQGKLNRRTYEKDGETREITELLVNRVLTPDPMREISILKRRMELEER